MVVEPVVFLAAHAIVEQVLIHQAVAVMAIAQVQRQEALLIQKFRLLL